LARNTISRTKPRKSRTARGERTGRKIANHTGALKWKGGERGKTRDPRLGKCSGAGKKKGVRPKWIFPGRNLKSGPDPEVPARTRAKDSGQEKPGGSTSQYGDKTLKGKRALRAWDLLDPLGTIKNISKEDRGDRTPDPEDS